DGTIHWLHVVKVPFALDGRPGYVLGVAEDITQQKETEQALAQSEERYRLISELVSDWAYSFKVNPDGSMELEWMTDAFTRISGYTVEEVNKQTWRLLIHPEDMHIAERKAEALLAGEPATAEFRMVTKDGRVVWVRDYGQPIWDEKEGRVVRIVGATRNITARKLAEEALRRERDRAQQYLDVAAVAMVALDPDGRVTLINRRGCELLGYSEKEILGKDWFAHFVPERVRQEVRQTFDALMRGEIEPVRYFENPILTKDGEERLFAWYNSVLRDDVGRIVGTLSSGQDITERRRAERALAESERKYRELVEEINDIVYSVDQEGKVLYMSPAVHALGYAPDEVVGRPMIDFIYHEDRERLLRALQRAAQSKITPAEFRVIDKAGRVHWVRTFAKPVFEGQKFEGLRGVLTDITSVKEASRKLERYAIELEQANKEIRDFAYIVSHDLRAPLVNLKGFAAELRAALEEIQPAVQLGLGELPEEKQETARLAFEEDIPEALGFIESSVDRMDKFISAVLRLSRLGRRELVFETIDMHEIVEEILESLAHQLEERKAQVKVLPLPQVVADRTSMEMVMNNLLSNAVKYLVPDRPGRIEIGGKRSGEETLFWVRDNGRGIAEEDADKVFALFRRAGAQDVPGEGMGLAYVKTLLRRHGGRIWFESTLGEGTTFFFTVPNNLAEEN
ncbi:MAG: PAS domain S-box protein, partial [Anaerolineae bacterium]|nr:PAS domain S-box protein [Anaerolineae bacterium]